MPTPSKKTVMYGSLALLTILGMLANVSLVRSLDAFGSPFFFTIGFTAELVLLVVLAYCLVRALGTPLRILSSLLISAWQGVRTNPYVARVQKSPSPVYAWLAARLHPRRPTGLVLTAGALLSLLSLIYFVHLLQAVLSHSNITAVDARVLNLMPNIRTPLQTSFFRFVTMTAQLPALLVVVGVGGIILWRQRQQLAAATLIAALLLEETIGSIFKHAVGRARPAASLQLIQAHDFSFPSGHALNATVMFGLVGYLLFRSFRPHVIRLGIVLSYIISVALVAISRIYLGVHYPSDVLGGILLGAALLILLITAIQIITQFGIWRQTTRSFSSKTLVIVPLATILFALVAAPVFVQFHQVSPIPKIKSLSEINQTTAAQLPHYSETLTAKTMEPISFIYVGSGQQIVQLLESHGWYRADPSTLANTLKAFAVGFQGRQYQNAPVTPSYLNAEPENLAFQKPTRSNTLRQRHHTRLWPTNFKTADGQEIWVATASYDEGIEFAGPAKLPTHHIDPNVDAERSYIVQSLGLHNVNYLQIVGSQIGTNASGDVFFTDGRAAVVRL